MTKFGSNLRRLRQERHMTQEQLAEKLHSAKQVISRYETGDRIPRADAAARIAAALDVPISYLVTDADEIPALPKPEGGEPMTLNDILIAAAVQRLSVTVTVSRTLTAQLLIDASDREQWDDLIGHYGDWRVREIRPVDERTIGLSLTEA